MKEEYLSGVTLDRYVQNNELDLKNFLHIAIELCKSLEGFHKQNITIGSLSRSSILIIDQENLSFSIKYNVQEEESDHIYRAPEQNERVGLRVDHTVDIYSLGVILYELLSQKLEGSAKSFQDSFYELITKELPSLHELDPSIPVIISEIIEKMTAKNRTERYDNIFAVHVDFAKSLRELKSESTISPFQLNTFQPIFQINAHNFMYGRESASKKIEKTINANDHRNAFVAVYGNSGVGKSFFMKSVLEKNKHHFSHILALKLEKYKQNAPYEILYDALRHFTRQLLFEEEDKLKSYREELQELLGDEAQILIDVIPEIETIIGKQPTVQDINPADKKARFDSMLFRFMELFFRSEKPFCVYIDDLQWADGIILQWMQNILLKLNKLFVFVTYRDEELNEEHKLKKSLDKLHAYDLKTEEIKLEDLTKENIKTLLHNTLQLKQTDEIADIIFYKTGGNAFFINQYIKQLQENGTIHFNYDTLKWYCDLERLKEMPVSDNVFEVLSQRIELLEEDVRTLLNSASCLGSYFTHRELQDNYEGGRSFEEILNELIADEWLVVDSKGGAKGYRFSHDKMQEAIYSKLDAIQLSEINYKIGNKVLQSEEKLQNKALIACVNHLNIGAKLFKDIELLIELNVQASLHSKKSGDFSGALNYITKAMEYIAHTDVKTVSVSILKDRAECEHLCHNSNEAVYYYEKALQLCKTNIQKAEVYELLIKFYSDISNFKKAYETGRKATQLFGFDMPKSFFPPQFIFDFIRLKIKLQGKSVDAISKLPSAQDEEFILLIKLAANSLQAAYQIKPELCVANAVKIVTLCLQKGLTKESVIAFTVFGVIFQGGILGDHTAGFNYYRLSSNMLKRFHNTIQHAEVKFVSGYFASSWKQAASQTEELWFEAYQNGLDIGDWFHTGCAAAGIIQSMFMRGVHLNTILEKIEQFLVVLENIGTMEQYGAIVSVKEAILSLQAKSSDFDEALFIASLDKYNSKHFAHYFYINKLTTLYIHKEYRQALEVSKAGKKFASDSKGMLHNTEHLFYEALTVAKLYETATFFSKIGYKRMLQKATKKFYKWSKDCAENFLARAYLLDGELHRLCGKNNEAIDLYEKASKTAAVYAQTNIKMLANRLIQEVYEQLGQKRAAELYKQAVLADLKEWGVQEEQQADETVAKFDIETLMQASEIIVKEQRLSNLLEALVKTIMTNSGAQNVFLLLREKEEFFIEAEYSLDDEKIQVMQHQAYLESTKIVQPIVNYVVRTQQALVIDNLNDSELFSKFTHADKERKSLLCAPLILKGELKGLIYLENNLLAGVFTEEKVKLLQYLSGQIAISIENALVYNNLEKAVRLRTEELENANQKLAKLSTLDPLTKISNRRHFEEHMENIWSVTVRKKVPISIVMCDIDYFKKINDTYGHVIGDHVLQNIASLIKNALKRTSDLAARYGGEEFIIALCDTDLEGAKQICQNIADTLKENDKNFIVDGIRIEPFTISFGISSVVAQEDLNYEQLIKDADKALYKAKENGRNCIFTDVEL